MEIGDSIKIVLGYSIRDSVRGNLFSLVWGHVNGSMYGSVVASIREPLTQTISVLPTFLNDDR